MCKKYFWLCALIILFCGPSFNAQANKPDRTLVSPTQKSSIDGSDYGEVIWMLTEWVKSTTDMELKTIWVRSVNGNLNRECLAGILRKGEIDFFLYEGVGDQNQHADRSLILFFTWKIAISKKWSNGELKESSYTKKLILGDSTYWHEYIKKCRVPDDLLIIFEEVINEAR